MSCHVVSRDFVPSHSPPVLLVVRTRVGKAQTLDIKWFSNRDLRIDNISDDAFLDCWKWAYVLYLCTCKIEYAGYGRCVTSIACLSG